MKKFNILFLALTSLFLTSCEEDSETNLVPKNYLIGKWETIKVGSLNANGALVYQDYVINSQCESDNFVFNENFSYTENDFVFLNSICTNNKSEGNYQLNGSDLVLKYKNELGSEVVETKRITNLTFTEMEINYTDSQTNQLVFLKLSKM